MPTLLDAANGKYPETFNGEKILPAEGESLLPALKGEKNNRTNPLFFEWRKGKAVIDGNWKIVTETANKGDKPEWELYNLNNDPTETYNLSDTQPEIVKKLNTFSFNSPLLLRF